MEMMASNKKLPAMPHRGETFNSDALEHAERRTLDTATFFPRKKYSQMKCSTRTDWVKYVAPVDRMTSFRILLVSKEQQERQSMCDVLLQNLNFSIDYLDAHSGEAALRIGAHAAVNLIIYGADISDMDGLEFLGRLNNKCGRFKIPVIEILDAESATKGPQALRMGAHDYLLKDISGQHFVLLPILVSRIYSEVQEINSLRQKVSVHQTLADSIPSVIYQLSLQGGAHDVHISRQIAELGLSKDKWGNDAELHHQLCHEADRPVVKAALEYSFKTGDIFQCEYRITTVGGVLRWFRDHAKVITDKYGRPAFLQGVMTDISGIRAMEAELRHYREMLDKMVRERTESLDRRLAILESCNSTLGENYHQMHLMYLDILNKAQTYENGKGDSGAAGTALTT